MAQLSETVKELIRKARIVSFTDWVQTHPPDAIALFQAADDTGRYLTDEDLQQIQILAPDTAILIPVGRQLRDRAAEIVDEARDRVLQHFPGITEVGGGLYPPDRAEACWRDFWHFLRCITYGIVGHHTEYTSTEGLHYMKLLYRELNVPLDAMVFGLEAIKAASLKRIDVEQQELLSPYFEHLITRLSQFRNSDF
jgi:Phycobilisome protein